METAANHWMDYSPWHLWFIFLLLIFYLLYAAYDFLKERFTAESRVDVKKTLNPFASLVVAGTAMIILYTVTSLFVAEWVWSQISIIHFQPVRIPVYGMIFFLGIHAGSGKWFIEKGLPGKMWIWGTASLLFSAALIPCMYYTLKSWGKILPWQFSLMHGFIRTGMVFSWLGFLVKFFLYRSDKKSNLDRISGVSYEIYIIHLPVMIAVARIFTIVTMPALLKFILAGTIVAGSSWGIGRYLIKPYPKTSCAVITAVFLALCLVYR